MWLAKLVLAFPWSFFVDPHAPALPGALSGEQALRLAPFINAAVLAAGAGYLEFRLRRILPPR